MTRLHRARFGEYDVAGLAPGEWRVLPLPPWCTAAGGSGSDVVGSAGAEAAEADADGTPDAEQPAGGA